MILQIRAIIVRILFCLPYFCVTQAPELLICQIYWIQLLLEILIAPIFLAITLPNYVFQYTSCISKSLKELHLHKTLHCWVRKTIYAPMQTRVCTLANIFSYCCTITSLCYISNVNKIIIFCPTIPIMKYRWGGGCIRIYCRIMHLEAGNVY